MGSLKVVLVLLRAMLISKVHLAAENLALRQQVAVYKQSVKRPKLFQTGPERRPPRGG